MILIKNVKIIDGSGKPAFPGDVLISGEKISAIGNLSNKKTETVIEGLGNYLVPGFIDINSEIDHDLSIFTNPKQQDLTKQGVTTAVGGHGGTSLAPLLYGSLKSIRKWTDINQVNVNWHDFQEFTQTIKKLPMGVNFCSLIGHSTIRRDIAGENSTDLTDPEISIFKATVEQALKDGAKGLSTGLNYLHGRQTPQKEIKELVSIVAKYNAIYTTHLRNEKEGIVKSINEIYDTYKKTGAKTIINRFLPFLGFEKEFELGYEIVQRGGDGFFFAVSPTDINIIPLYTLLPLWAQKGNLQEMTLIIKNPINEKKIIAELPKIKGDSMIMKAYEHNYLINKTIKNFAENRGIGQSKALLELMRVTSLRGLIAVKDINYELILKLIEDNKALIKPPFNDFLSVANEKRWPLEKAIAKITSLPAQILNLKNRGMIRENYFADLVLLNNNEAQKVVINGESNFGHILHDKTR
ncbi:MAG: hypothetical protein AAB890_00420 [Patescibacteria group bacterium]